MSNMSYCMFENTLADLQEAHDKLTDIDSLSELSESEQKAARKLIKLCNNIAEKFDEFI